MEPKLTLELLAALGDIPADRNGQLNLARNHAVEVGHYRGQLVSVAIELSKLKAYIATEARHNLTATGGKATDKAVEEQVDSHTEVQELRERRDLLEAAVETLKSREAVLLELLRIQI